MNDSINDVPAIHYAILVNTRRASTGIHALDCSALAKADGRTWVREDGAQAQDTIADAIDRGLKVVRCACLGKRKVLSETR